MSPTGAEDRWAGPAAQQAREWLCRADSGAVLSASQVSPVAGLLVRVVLCPNCSHTRPVRPALWAMSPPCEPDRWAWTAAQRASGQVCRLVGAGGGVSPSGADMGTAAGVPHAEGSAMHQVGRIKRARPAAQWERQRVHMPGAAGVRGVVPELLASTAHAEGSCRYQMDWT